MYSLSVFFLHGEQRGSRGVCRIESDRVDIGISLGLSLNALPILRVFDAVGKVVQSAAFAVRGSVAHARAGIIQPAVLIALNGVGVAHGRRRFVSFVVRELRVRIRLHGASAVEDEIAEIDVGIGGVVLGLEAREVVLKIGSVERIRLAALDRIGGF